MRKYWIFPCLVFFALSGILQIESKRVKHQSDPENCCQPKVSKGQLIQTAIQIAVKVILEQLEQSNNEPLVPHDLLQYSKLITEALLLGKSVDYVIKMLYEYCKINTTPTTTKKSPTTTTRKISTTESGEIDPSDTTEDPSGTTTTTKKPKRTTTTSEPESSETDPSDTGESSDNTKKPPTTKKPPNTKKPPTTTRKPPTTKKPRTTTTRKISTTESGEIDPSDTTEDPSGTTTTTSDPSEVCPSYMCQIENGREHCYKYNYYYDRPISVEE